ncbi:hypothetical protein FOZ61_002995 [Perkinsus olseni]|uniref:tRNA carboxymethyluridine synthase n=1 Tax=Perkinsus olseni TaxID=32597 RepID=A0A7J6MDX9_PEROL|nr:hypothetical protein FOZ61_002995 [Perkinsus olseni]
MAAAATSSKEGVETEASAVGDTTAEMGREHMVEGQEQYDVCTTDAQTKHMKAKDLYTEEWTEYQHRVKADTDWPKVEGFVKDLLDYDLSTEQSYKASYRAVLRKAKLVPSKAQLQAAYTTLVTRGDVQQNEHFERIFLKKSIRSNSGVVVITIVTAPGPFSCPNDCYYCPNEPGQPRSYLSTEPAVARANQNKFDPVLQFWDRATTLARQGHTVDKVEIIVLGGTWSFYPHEYQEQFCRDLFYAANIFNEAAIAKNRKLDVSTLEAHNMPSLNSLYRSKLSLEEEQVRNEVSDCKIIGLTLETRPDYVNPTELRRLRTLGCTRVQIGVQHTDNQILKTINRGHTVEDSMKAVKLLKESCFKVDIHLMPDLPTSNPEKDREMFKFVLETPYLQADHWKIYPCEVTPFSMIEKWYSEGSYMPYTEKDPKLLVDLLVWTKARVHPWIRLNRVIRDIPEVSIIAGNQNTNLRQMIFKELAKQGKYCRCIRCREVRDWPEDESLLRLAKRWYRSSDGDECFLSFEGSIDRGVGGGATERGMKKRQKKEDKKKNKKKNRKHAEEQAESSASSALAGVGSFVVAKLTEGAGKCVTMQQSLWRRARSWVVGAGLEDTTPKDNAPLYGLLRLRFNDNGLTEHHKVFPELSGCALIRELHVYGTVQAVRQHKNGRAMSQVSNATSLLSSSHLSSAAGGTDVAPVQHTGLGRRLLAEAERMAVERGYSKIAVISGVGVRNYYRKFGYEMPGEGVGHFLIKDLSSEFAARKEDLRHLRRRQIVLESTAAVGVAAVCGLGLAYLARHKH